MSRKAKWWLIAAVVLASGVGLLIVTSVLAYLFLGFGDDDLGPHDLDAGKAAEGMQLRGIGIPNGSTFEQMMVVRQFVGADSYRGHYTMSGTFEAAKQALAQANPDFPGLRSATCGDEIVNQDFLVGEPEFHCDAETELAVSTRSVDGADVLTDNYRGTPPDSETVLLVGNGNRVELFVLSQGH
ncbi:hypothetical protein FR943_03455 [Mycobacterium sp. TNTM28]|uniref:Uncharacterized protein n=1 Tax=[Mycobacterium] fortunisiensis TaxID=2600579 RepID=A0ABS6KHC7_9MYCO|nr:hypothetical protein [[Mycobacterium] fortunisiensis]MBU9762911.1 hypothetical protein [[Mycobacterium] fortunisiensis]